MPEGLPLPAIQRALRIHFAEHNRRVVLLTFLALVATSALWLLLHAALGWLSLLAITTIQGVDARAPAFIEPLFWNGAAVLLALAWIDRRLRPDDRPRDHKSPAEILWEILLALPRATLAIGATLSNWQKLSPPELVAAAELVERLSHERRLLLHSLPLEIPDEARRTKVLLALQLVRVVDVRREDHQLWIALNPLRPTTLIAQREPPAMER